MSDKWNEALEKLWERSRFTSFFYQSVKLIPSEYIPTLALTVSDRRIVLKYNPAFVDETNVEELIGLLVHEMMHVILSHNHRVNPGEDPFQQNHAQDMVINSYIKANEKTFFSVKGKRPEDCPPLIIPDGLPVIPGDFYKETEITDPTWEEVYEWFTMRGNKKLIEFLESINDHFRHPPDAEGKSDGQHSESEDIPGEALEHSSSDDFDQFNNDGFVFRDNSGNTLPTGMHMFHDDSQRSQMESSLRRMLDFAKDSSTFNDDRVFDDIEGIIKKIRHTEIKPWKNQLKSILDFTSPTGKWDYSYNRFNRRYFANEIYSAGRVLKPMELLTVVVDVSSSMVTNPADLETAFGIIEDLLDRFTVHLLCVDETVFIPERKDNYFRASKESKKPYIYKKGDWKFIKTGTSGTTFFESLFNEYMLNHREMLLVITDGYIYDLNKLKTYQNTLWLITENRKEPFTAPFGKTIYVKNEIGL